jgi:hypothetical protein
MSYFEDRLVEFLLREHGNDPFFEVQLPSHAEMESVALGLEGRGYTITRDLFKPRFLATAVVQAGSEILRATVIEAAPRCQLSALAPAD